MSVGRRSFLKGVGVTLGLAVAGLRNGVVLAGPGADVIKRRELFGPMGDTIDDILDVERPVVHLPTISDHLAQMPDELDPLRPDHWAKLYAQTIRDEMVLGNLIHRDWSDQLCMAGDCLNLRRYTEIDSCVQFMMDGHFYSSFVVRDGESSLSMPELYDYFIRPAAMSHARGLDCYIYEELRKSGQTVNVSDMASAPLMIRGKLNQNNAPLEGRACLLPPEWDTAVLKSVDIRRETILGGYMSFAGQNCYMSQCVTQPIGFTRTSAALAARPLPKPASFGIRSGQNDDYKMSVRCVMMYDIDTAGTRVTFDSLVGVGVLEPNHIVHIGRNA